MVEVRIIKSVILENFKGTNLSHVKEICTPVTIGLLNFPLFAVYEKPEDYPDKYVVRLWQINRQLGKPLATRFCIVKDTLEECRQALPGGLYRLGRESSDDPVIIETWI